MERINESDPLLLDSPPVKKTSSWRTPAAVGSLLLLGAGVFGVSSSWSSGTSSSLKEDGAVLTSSHGPAVYLNITSSYYPTGEQPGNGLYPWTYIAEIYQELGIELVILDHSSGPFSKFEWYVADELVDTTTDASITHTFSSAGYTDLSVKAYDLDGSLAETYDFDDEIMVRYIKREIRSMSTSDRVNFLDALETVYRTRTSEGQAIYGSKYKGIEELVNKHLYGAGQRDCDHWHDDAGIMTHHLGITIELELVLQTIDPSITIPYWEYTYDAYYYEDEWKSSPIFNDDWFGAASPSNHFHAVMEGRFGKIPMFSDYDESFSPFSNPYGQLRSPWNMNKSPYAITRHDLVTHMGTFSTLPSCTVFNACWESSTLSELNYCLGGGTHGPVHILLGGQWGLNLTGLVEETVESLQLLLFKNLWRRGFTACPDSCDDDDDCSCKCPSHIIEKVGGAYEVLTKYTHIAHWIGGDYIRYDSDTGKFYFQGDETEISKEDAMWSEILESLCDPGSVGEMYSSAAPWDPIFWIIHTTAERLLQYKRLLAYHGESELKQEWGYTHYDADSDLGVVCDWSSVDGDNFELPECITGTCTGHKATDKLPWDFSDLDVSLKEPTNVELYHFIGPEQDHIYYVYDNFYWTHCYEMDAPIGDDPDEVYARLVAKGKIQAKPTMKPRVPVPSSSKTHPAEANTEVSGWLWSTFTNLF